ncbi:MAG: DUF5658 family protein [Acidimicrobiales bacterium]
MANGAEQVTEGVPGVRALGRRTGAAGVLAEQIWAMCAGLVVLNVLDIITTAMVIRRGGAERNPFVQPVIDSMWQISALKGLVLVVVATLLMRCRESRIAQLALAGTTGWYLAVVLWNTAVLTVV